LDFNLSIQLKNIVYLKTFEPSVGILPLGTGNDLSRALMWGQGYVGEVDLEDILIEMSKAKLVKMDRWKIEFARVSKESKKRTSNSSDESAKSTDTNKQIKFMNNYFSVGCDALVTLNFHRRRNSMYFANRLINKVTSFYFQSLLF
jgi:diacylglycerol kinase (ATP)